MRIKYLPVGQLGTNCYIVCNEEAQKCVVIDPGAEAARIESAIRETGCAPELVLLTHGHFDHIGAVRALIETYGCKLAVPKAELDFLNDPNRNLHNSMGGGEWKPFQPDILYVDGDVVEAAGLSFKAFHTPGHTPGSSCLLCGNDLFTGDTLFAGSAGRTDFYGGDPAAMRASLGKIKHLPGNYRVLPGHGGFSTLDEERVENPFLGGQYDL